MCSGHCRDGINSLGGYRFDIVYRPALGVEADRAAVSDQRQLQVQSSGDSHGGLVGPGRGAGEVVPAAISRFTTSTVRAPNVASLRSNVKSRSLT